MTEQETHEQHGIWEIYQRGVESVVGDSVDDFLRYSYLGRIKSGQDGLTVEETYMEHDLFRFHVFHAVVDWIRAQGEDPYEKMPSHSYGFIQLAGEIQYSVHPGYLSASYGLLPFTSLCDMQRVLSAIVNLPSKHTDAMWHFAAGEGESTYDDREALTADLASLVGNTVDVQVISTGRVIAMSQMVGDEGDKEIRRYKGGSDLDGVMLGECETHNNNLVIIKKADGILPADEKVVKITNGFKDKLVKLTSTKDTTPKGEDRAVYTVFSVAPRILTGSDLTRSWKVSLVDPPTQEDAD